MHVLLLANLLGVVLSDLCSRKRLAANLVASGQDLKGVVRATAAGQAQPDVPLTRGWRARHILPELLAVLDGSHALRVVKPNSSAPLDYMAVSEPLPPEPAGLPDDSEEMEPMRYKETSKRAPSVHACSVAGLCEAGRCG
jgi:ribonuclease D